MKRPSSNLVDYEISEEEEESPQLPSPPLKKKRTLPPLSSSFLSPVPVDDPALHQGRKRSTPHVEGQFAAYVYIPIKVSRHTQLYKLLQDVFKNARETVVALHEHWPVDSTRSHIDLHVSLSRPIYLRAHQREELKRSVREITRKNNKFSLSFATFSELTNDEKTRTFLTMEVGAGHNELKGLSDSLTPVLQAIRQKEFYTEPRFHASIAWALLDREDVSSTFSSSSTVSNALATSSPITDNADGCKFPTIPRFPEQLIPALVERFGATLPVASVFDVDTVAVKIGKEVTSWTLRAF